MSKVLKTIVNVILFCAIVVAAGLLIPPFAGVTTVMVDDVDMQTNLSQGSVANAVEKDSSELKQGDKVLVSQDGGQYVYVVDSIDGSSVVLDDQLSTDGGTTQQELGSTVQKVMLVVPVIGYVSMALRNTEGLIIVGLSLYLSSFCLFSQKSGRKTMMRTKRKTRMTKKTNPKKSRKKNLQ